MLEPIIFKFEAMQLFYTQNIKDQEAYFEGEEARHIIQVLRYQAGQTIQFIDGKGHFYTGTLTQISKKNCIASIQNIRAAYNDRPYSVSIAIAPTKNINRFEWFLEKSTELGINRVIPLKCERSVRKQIRNDRLEKIILSATKQSLKAQLPELMPLTEYKSFLNEEFSGQQFIAHCEETQKDLLSKKYQTGRDVTILIGPEGDFSPSEIALALKAGFEPVSLGESRLRTETAGIAACHTIHILNQ